jgi:capsular exopolysaccharide synthesis family protein
MSRLHDALQRASDGKMPILPREAGIPESESPAAGQAAFTVPWTLDNNGADAPAKGEAAARAGGESGPSDAVSPVFTTSVARSAGAASAEVAEKLVGNPVSSGNASLSIAVEQYRKLAATLHHAQAARILKLIMVTSANPGEGKSLTATNLAITLSESYQRRVLLVDADLRRPSLHVIFGVPNGSGLSDGLARATSGQLPVVEVSPRLSVLPSGHTMADPTTALSSNEMRAVLEEARAAYDWVIIDTPPVGLLTDAKLLGAMVDAVVLVIEAGRTPCHDAARAIDAVGRDRVLGAVLNRHTNGGDTYYYKSYYAHRKSTGA